MENNHNFFDTLAEIVGTDNVFIDVPMKNHTSFKVGGNADFLLTPTSADMLMKVLAFLKQCEANYYVMGNGTNLLVKDGGYRGVIVKILQNMSGISCEGNVIKAEAGALLSVVSKFALENGLGGMEFAEGIPGTVGGAVTMNAGAYGGEMKNVVKSVTVLDNEGNISRYNNKDMDFSYRNSLIQKKGFICLSAEIELEKQEQSVISQKMRENRQARIDKQPLEKASAGSTFKRPVGYFAGKLIMDSGLRGHKIGGAQVSDKHCGFVINNGAATAKDIVGLIEHVQKTVYENFNVRLEPEVRIIGEW